MSTVVIAEDETKKSRDELLKYFIEVSRDKWCHLIKSMQIRLEGTDGEFRNGGFITDISGDIATTGTIKVGNFPRTSANRPGYKEFTFKGSDIKRIWKRVDRFSFIENARLITSINILTERSDAQESKIKALILASTTQEAKIKALELVIIKIVGEIKRNRNSTKS